MHLRTDIAPLPIGDLAPTGFGSTDPDEPFMLGCGDARVTGRCRLALSALRPADPSGSVAVDARGADVHTLITPCGVVRTARLGGVLVTERLALTGFPAATVSQWTVDGGATLVVDGFDDCWLEAGQTATAVYHPAASAARADGPADVEQAFRVFAGRLSHAVRAGLQLQTGDGTGAALAWAKARLWTHACAGDLPAFPASLAALVAGRPDDARLHLERRTIGLDLFPLVAARYAAWTGDVRVAGEVPLQLRALDALRAPAGETGAALWLAGLAAFERTATDLGDPAFAGDLHSLARRHRAALAGRPLSAHAGAILTALRAPLPATPRPDASRSVDVAAHAWLTWATLEQGGLRDGLGGWRRLLAEADAPVRGAWPDRFETAGDDAAATALFILTLAHGLLGIQPDAPRHRIGIAPRLGRGAPSIAARGIRCGDGNVSLTVSTDGPAVTLTLVQDDGAIPLTALLEPVIDGEVAATFVDGRPAELNVRPHGEGMMVPVQLVLDAERTLRVERALPQG